MMSLEQDYDSCREIQVNLHSWRGSRRDVPGNTVAVIGLRVNEFYLPLSCMFTCRGVTQACMSHDVTPKRKGAGDSLSPVCVL